jgi:hypothetical protein
MIIAMVAAASYFFGRDVVEKQFPNTVSSVKFVPNPPFIDVGE